MSTTEEQGNNLDRVIEWFMTETLAAKLQGKHIRNQAGANMVYNHACNIANKLGLDEFQRRKIVPYPAPTNFNVINTYPEFHSEKETTTRETNDKPQPPVNSPQPSAEPKSQPKDDGSPLKGMLPWILAAAGAAGGAGGVGLGAYLSQPEKPEQKQEQPVQADDQEGSVGFTIRSN